MTMDAARNDTLEILHFEAAIAISNSVRLNSLFKTATNADGSAIILANQIRRIPEFRVAEDYLNSGSNREPI